LTTPRRRQLSAEKLVLFPSLSRRNHQVTSDETGDYNCAAWAAGVSDEWWWPIPVTPENYWPPGIERQPSIDSFLAAYRTLGYEQCPDGSVEDGFEKVVFYASRETPSVVKHVALQLPSGRWTSKLGKLEDIEHETEQALEGATHEYSYHFVAAYMRRQRNA
jgi:hypothetical protein